jgi:hypothetical protein
MHIAEITTSNILREKDTEELGSTIEYWRRPQLDRQPASLSAQLWEFGTKGKTYD